MLGVKLSGRPRQSSQKTGADHLDLEVSQVNHGSNINAHPEMRESTSTTPQDTLGSLCVLFDVTLKVDFSTLRKKALAALGATLAENIAACFSAHAGTETVLTFADTLGRLVSAFHGERRN